MKPIQSVDDLYPGIDEIIGELQAAGQSKLATILHHRMHQVAWTTRDELLEELQSLLGDALRSQGLELPEKLRETLRHTEHVISNYLRNLAS